MTKKHAQRVLSEADVSQAMLEARELVNAGELEPAELEAFMRALEELRDTYNTRKEPHGKP